MAKTYMDHSSLLSLNQIKIEDFKPNTVIYIPNCRGYFTEKALNQPTNYRIVIASLKKSFYFYPHQKDLMVYQKQFSEPNHTTKKYFFFPYQQKITSLHLLTVGESIPLQIKKPSILESTFKPNTKPLFMLLSMVK
jgi:hypothetical protein